MCTDTAIPLCAGPYTASLHGGRVCLVGPGGHMTIPADDAARLFREIMQERRRQRARERDAAWDRALCSPDAAFA